ncbi:hypothetical protein P3S68_022687 [Capsicum galapagoense]
MGSTNQDDADAIIGVAATSVLAAGVAIIGAYEHESSIPREPYVNKDQEREFYMNSILNGSDVHCVGQIRMSKHAFYELCNDFRRNSFLCSTKNISVQEQVLIFLEIVGFNERFRKIESHFYRSIESIHRCFHTMLQAIKYVFAGWKESAHDSRILNDALERPHGLQIQQVNHGKKGEKQFRWSKLMEYLMLEILADEVNQGNKSTNQFKASSFNRVLNAINKQLEIDCKSKHVGNHLKTIRNTWSTIQTLPNKSGLGWDDNLKVITASPEVYAVHIQAHPNHDKFINKKIKIFDEISLVCGNDRARGDCAKSFEDIDFDSFSEKDNDNDLEGPSIEKDVQATEASQIKVSRKRKRSFEMQDVIGNISIKFGEVATTIGRMVDSRLDVTKFYEEVMAMKGYNEAFFGDTFDYLVQSDTLAKAFMVKNQNIRKVWLERFKQQQ